MNRKISRRTFFFGGALALAGCATGTRRAARRVSANEKLNIAGIGVGGMGGGDVHAMAGENIVALCDVDWKQAGGTFKDFPNAGQYKDFRRMLDKEHGNIDAVTVSTPDHVHAFAAMAAIELGKHVRVQKPLTHTVEEARKLAQAARKYKVVTQMGNQGHAEAGVREACEMLWSGVIGQVREVHAWTDRPAEFWPTNVDRPEGSDPIPDTLDWDLWLGPSPARPYVAIHPKLGKACYCPNVWRGWWDFGCGALGDMGCHILDPANWALHLGAPTSVEAVEVNNRNKETAPRTSIVRYVFPERKDPKGNTLPAVTLSWYEGGLKPTPPPESGLTKDALGGNGSLFVGEKGYMTIGCYGDNPTLLPEAKWKDYKKPDPHIPRVDGGSYAEWIRACKGGEKPGSNFDYAGPFTEWVLLGNLAVRASGIVRWDAAKMKVVNSPEADALVRGKYRKGWTL
jgi:predicted dehydrogenase